LVDEFSLCSSDSDWFIRPKYKPSNFLKSSCKFRYSSDPKSALYENLQLPISINASEDSNHLLRAKREYHLATDLPGMKKLFSNHHVQQQAIYDLLFRNDSPHLSITPSTYPADADHYLAGKNLGLPHVEDREL
jgi:hypothetical protein